MLQTRIFCFITALFMSGCVAVVVAGAAASMVVYDKRSMSTMERDARIFHVIHTGVVNDRRFRDSRIVVVSFNQVVLLLGQTRDPALRLAVKQMAQNTPNVRRVYDEISIGDPLSISSKTQDSFLTGQVRTRMLQRKGLESGSIRVVTEGAVVYLMGIVTQEQSNLAVDVARQINGVQKVVKVFQYIM